MVRDSTSQIQKLSRVNPRIQPSGINYIYLFVIDTVKALKPNHC